jgi:hypothetical protein
MPVGQASKRAKTKINNKDSEHLDSESQLDSSRPQTPSDDLHNGEIGPSEPEEEVTQEPNKVSSRPRARPLRDPL